MPETLVIPRRFNGPPESANGGYTCGRIAELAGGLVEVTLRKPPPLETPLAVERSAERVSLWDGDELVAEGEAAELELDVPESVSVEEAEAARKRYHGFKQHAYATCFVCGPDRADGLGVFPGPVLGRGSVVAAPWLPAPGETAEEILWAALDCPSGWAVDDFGRSGVLLGQMAARVLGGVVEGAPYVVIGWKIGEEGRKRFAGSALFDEGGGLVAFARTTWLVPRAG